MERPNMPTKEKRPTLKMDSLKWFNHIQIHGAKRLASREASWYWIPSMILLLVFASVLLYSATIRYLSNPTFMLEIDSGRSISAFPSVLIYPGIHFRTYKKNEFLSKIKYPKDLNETYIRLVLPQLAVSFSPDVPFKPNDLVNIERFLNYNNIDVEKAGRQLTENCEDILIRCRWDNSFVTNCTKFFRLDLAGDGFCCVFNGRSLRREMQVDRHIKKRKPVYHSNRIGWNSGLTVAINQTQRPLTIDLSYKWIALQESDRFIDTPLNSTPLNPGMEQWISYYVQSTYISEDAKRLGTNLRRCVLPDEGLKYFPIYRRRYCALECEMANTIKRCGCVRLTHPKPPGVAYCDARRMACALRAFKNTESCNCPPTCEANNVYIRTSSFVLDPTVPSFDKFYSGLNYQKVTVLKTFLEKRSKGSKERYSYYSYVNLFSQIGGTFNLFFGCSVLSILGMMRLVWTILATVCTRLLNKILRRKKSISTGKKSNQTNTLASDSDLKNKRHRNNLFKQT